MSILDDPDDVVARHEAGHAVASYRLRGFVGTVMIDPPTAEALGGTEVWVLQPPLVGADGRVVPPETMTKDDDRAFRDAATIAAAGPLAETIYWSFREYEEALIRNSDDQAKIDSIVRNVWPHRHTEVEAEVVGRARCLLEREWDAVERLATALERDRVIDGSCAAALINGS